MADYLYSSRLTPEAVAVLLGYLAKDVIVEERQGVIVVSLPSDLSSTNLSRLDNLLSRLGFVRST